MKNPTTPESVRQINNLVARIKAHYPHLYEETGGKYIRKILKDMLDAASAPVTESPLVIHSSDTAMHSGNRNYKDEKYLHARVIKHKHAQQKAA